MAKVFVSAARGGLEGGFRDPGVIAGGTTEAVENMATRDLLVTELRSRGIAVDAPGDDLSALQTIAWINGRAGRQDVAIEIALDGSSNEQLRGATAFHIANNSDRRRHAELILSSLIRRVPELPSRGARPDTAGALGRIAFCRDTVPPSLVVELGFLTNAQDRRLLQTRRRDFAVGLADGLQSWLREVSGATPTPTPTPDIYPAIGIQLNAAKYPEPGILVAGNAYIPQDIVDLLGIALGHTTLPRLRYRNIVYVQAIALRDFGVAVSWDNRNRAVVLKTIFRTCVGQIDRIMGLGATSEVQLELFLKNNNENALVTFRDLPRLYREEGAIEGVNHDIAFCQMCLETGFLRFGNDVRPEQNNFAGLGAVGGGAAGASFPDRRTGVRAHIQHLKAYASTAPLVQPLVNPRFQFVSRGVAPLVGQLAGRWAVDPLYGDKILALVRRLYESAGLF
ncbi:MAG: hormogonium tapered terminus morphoprotein TftA [Pseudanabaenaceae cyanobacterium]